MDLKNILQENEKPNKKEKKINESTEVHKKPIQLRDIESRSLTNRKIDDCASDKNIQDLLNQEKKDCYKQSWNKLDKGMKLNRLRLFIKKEIEDKKLSEETSSILENLLITACKTSKLNKNADVSYDSVNGEIQSIKHLKYEKDKYTFVVSETKKVRHTSKSRSNVDRFLKNGK
jgi:hypothetical protein|tara:strand:- start:2 stop:523 length:522 start_codon:yes stop_codon:yes gene_type:complete